MDFSQVSGPLMTPPISPATLVHRGSVINQGPMTGRAPTSSSATTCPSSSSSCLSSISAMSQPSPCSSYQETLYHCLPQTSSSYFPAGGGSSASSYQPALRSDLFGIVQHCTILMFCLTYLQAPVAVKVPLFFLSNSFGNLYYIQSLQLQL